MMLEDLTKWTDNDLQYEICMHFAYKGLTYKRKVECEHLIEEFRRREDIREQRRVDMMDLHAEFDENGNGRYV